MAGGAEQKMQEAESLGAGFGLMDTAFLSRTLFRLNGSRLLLARPRWSVQHMLDHLVTAAGGLIIFISHPQTPSLTGERQEYDTIRGSGSHHR
jgi:hypothetical protein